MTNDKDLIFEKYLEILNEGIKSQAGVGGTTGPVSPEEVARRSDITKELRVKSDVQNGKVFNVLDLLGEFYKGGREQAKKEITKYMGNENTKSVLNPLEDESLEPYEIPLFNLPNRILSIKGLKTVNPDASSSDYSYQQFLQRADKALSELYKQQTGGDPNNINELNLILSFMSRLVRLSRNAGENPRTVLQRSRVGGYSKDDQKYIHITNIKEDHPRLYKYANLLFGFDVREGDKPEISEPERQQEVEDRINKQVQKYAWELTKKQVTGEDFKKAIQKYRAELAGRKEPNAITVSEPPQTPSTPEPEKKPATKKKTATKKPATKKPATKKPATKKPATKKKPATGEKKVNKESYFIKLIPF
jgi:hypothetical protein